MATGNEKNFELKIGKTGLIIVITGMTALLCASFLFGIDVGKNIDTYPGKIASFPQKALALVWRPAKVQIAQSAPEENINLNYHNALMNKKGMSEVEPSFEKQPEVPQSKNEETIQKGKFNIETSDPALQAHETNVERADSKVKEQLKEKETLNDKKETKEKEVILKNTANDYKFIVQVASLKEKSKAGQINKTITALGFKSEIIKADLQGKGIMFRVIASGFDDKLKAHDAAIMISKKTGMNCIVKKIDKKINKI